MENIGERRYLIGSERDYLYWERKYKIALEFMRSRQNSLGSLIEIAAQHPLTDGVVPNEEFEKRLLFGKTIYEKERAQGQPVQIYIPGSVHVHNGIKDKISLSEAGRIFLEGKGVPREDLFGEALNEKYKPGKGVYNSADECYVASCYFRDSEFGRLISVCSPAQMMRKTIHYLEFGVLPLNYTVPICESHHNYFYEIFEAIPYALLIDPSMQSEDSIKANKIRNERAPRDES